MRIFIDVGAHFGETTEMAANPMYGFDQIIAIEPSTLGIKRINQIRYKNICVFDHALGKFDGCTKLYSAGNLGASIFADKNNVPSYEIIKIREVSKFFKELGIEKYSTSFLKLNCEGGEADIIQNLYKNDILNLFTHIYIDLDILKIPSLEKRESEVRNYLNTFHGELIFADQLQETGWLGVNALLASMLSPVPSSIFARYKYKFKLYLSFSGMVFRIVRLLVPKKLVILIKSFSKKKGNMLGS